jgi:hypothetical protein
LVEPLDDMEKPAWSPTCSTGWPKDLAANRYDLKRTIGLIMTSRAYQMPIVELPAEHASSEGPAGEREASERPTGERLPAPYVFPRPARPPAVGRAVRRRGQHPDRRVGEVPGVRSRLDYTARGTLGGPHPLPAWVWTDEPVTTGVRRGAWQVARARGNAAQKAAAPRPQKLIDADAPGAS